MRYLCFIFIVAVSSLAKSQEENHEYSETLKTPHFKVRYKKGQTTQSEAQVVGEKAELFYKRLKSYLGRKPNSKITIFLEGNRGDDPKHKWAYVDDSAGGMHLFRFSEDTFAYQTGLSHELIHAYRFDHLNEIEKPPSPAFIFLEEGLAEFLSNVIEPKKETFANYGYDLDIAVGQWIESNDEIPLEILFKEQYRLRSLCIPQSYTEQASFVQFIEMKLGKETIIRLAYAKDVRDDKSLASYLKGSLSEWIAKWKLSTIDRFNKIPNHSEFGRKWRSKTPVADMHICKKGIEF